MFQRFLLQRYLKETYFVIGEDIPDQTEENISIQETVDFNIINPFQEKINHVTGKRICSYKLRKTDSLIENSASYLKSFDPTQKRVSRKPILVWFG